MAGVLDGIRLLEVTRVVPGAFCCMMLADMGADVIKIESTPAQSRRGKPDPKEVKRAAFNYTDRNKKSIALDLKSAEGQRIFQQLAKTADVLVEGFRPGVMKRLNADYETLSQINPRLIYVSLTGYGQNGPYRDLPGHDINYLSLAGLLTLIGKRDELPTIPLAVIGDFGGATMHGVIGVLLALFGRERTGRGQHVDVSYLDAAVAMCAAVPGNAFHFLNGKYLKRGEHVFSGEYPFYNCYETKDGRLLSAGSQEKHLWENFCRAIDREDLAAHYFQNRHFFESADDTMKWVTAELRELFKTKTCDEWLLLFHGHDTCVAKVNSWNEVFDDPHVKERNMVVELDDPVAGKVKHVAPAIKLSEQPGTVRTVAPYLGQHTEATLQELGYAPEEIADLKERGVVG